MLKLQLKYIFDITQAGVAPSSSSVSLVREEILTNLQTGPHYSDYYDPFVAEPAPGKMRYVSVETDLFHICYIFYCCEHNRV